MTVAYGDGEHYCHSLSEMIHTKLLLLLFSTIHEHIPTTVGARGEAPVSFEIELRPRTWKYLVDKPPDFAQLEAEIQGEDQASAGL